LQNCNLELWHEYVNDGAANDHANGMTPAFDKTAKFYEVLSTDTEASLTSNYLEHKIIDGGAYVTGTDAPCA